MIHYALRCGGGHEFDGWFKDSASFDAQAAGGLLDCPICADTTVQRALMAPRLRTRRPAAAPAEPSASPAAPEAPPGDAPPPAAEVTKAVALPPRGGEIMPDQVRAMLQRIRAEVEKTCDYVGPRFAATARRMHTGNEPPRPIYGEATPDEAEMLAEDGIDVARVPWVPRADG